MIWIGILIGIVIMMISHYAVNAYMSITGSRDVKKYQSRILDIMIQGNALREARNEMLERIADRRCEE